jgi:flagellar assembly protein FliH
MQQQAEGENKAPPQNTAKRKIAEHKIADRIEIFQYPADPDAPPEPDWSALAQSDGEASTAVSSDSQADPTLNPVFEQRLADEKQRAFEQGRERGLEESRQAARESIAATLRTAQESQMRQMAALTESFAAARDRYLHDVEHEVVKLALAIAARILRREAQMDPLLLTGAARVALGQLASTTEVKLRVPAGDLDLWQQAIALIPNLPLKPAVVAADGLRTGDCMVETCLGTVDLGIRAQLAEIERGFFDRPDFDRPDFDRPDLDHSNFDHSGSGRSALSREAAGPAAARAGSHPERRA